MRKHDFDKNDPLETVYITQHGVFDTMSGTPLLRGQEYMLPSKAAKVRYQRGHAKPAAEVYLERMKQFGVSHVTIRGNAEPSVKEACMKLGIQHAVAEKRPARQRQKAKT